MNKVKNEIKDTMIIYKKENPSFNTLGNIYTDPYTKELKYKEHMVVKADSNISLTSSERVVYHEEINGILTKKWIFSNLLGEQTNGKNQYGLRYELKENYWTNFSETEKLNINTLKQFDIFNKNSLIAYKYRIWVSIKAQDEWNVLFRGQSSHQSRIQINREESFVNLNKKLSKMSNSEFYQYMQENIALSDMFWMQEKYYNHFRNFNYYTTKEWKEVRKKEMQDYKESMMKDKDDLL
jgi:hypothetical protein